MAEHRLPGSGWTSRGLRVLAAGGLAVDAYVHFDLAAAYDAVGGSITQGMLFRIEAAAATLVALLLLLVGRTAVYVSALLVAGSALAAVLVHRWIDVGAIGPLPNMYEPIWYQDKTISAFAEGAAAVAAALLVVMALGAGRGRGARHRLTDAAPRPPQGQGGRS